MPLPFVHAGVTAIRGRRSRLAQRLTMAACVLVASGTIAQAAEGGAARVSLLPAGPRASVVVELDEAAGGATAATAIEATDNHTVAVEIGPVRGKVANQLLQAAADSPLVSQVRVRGVTQGTAGTVLTIHILAKSPISGSVRRTARRIYIDLAPRATGGTPPDTGLRAVTDPKPRPVPDNRTAVNSAAPASAQPVASATTGGARPSPPAAARPLTPAGVTASAASTRPTTGPAKQPTKAAANAATGVAAGATGTSAQGAVAPASASAVMPGPPAAAAPIPVPAPYAARLSPPPDRAVANAGSENSALTSASGGQAPVAASGPAASMSDLESRAARLVQTADVRGLSRLKTEIEARKVAATGAGAADFDGLLGRVDQFIDAAQRNRLAADAELFRNSGSTASAPPSAGGPAPSAGTPAPATVPVPTAPAVVPPPAAAASATVAPPANGPGAAPTLAVPAPPPVAAGSSLPLPGRDGRPANVLSPAASQAATAQAVPDFTAEFRPVRPQLEQLGRAARTWREASPTPQDLASISAVVAQLRMLHPPPHLAASFSNLRTSLELLELWGGASRTPTPSEVALVERARQAIESFLALDRQSGQTAQ